MVRRATTPVTLTIKNSSRGPHFIFLFMSAALVVLSARYPPPRRARVFLLLSVAFVCLQLRFAVPSLLVLAAAIGIHYATLRWMLWLPPQASRAGVFWAWLVLTLLGFVGLRRRGWTWIRYPYSFAGIVSIPVYIRLLPP